MTDQDWFDEWLDERLEPIATKLGVSEDTPPENLTRELGYLLGSEFKAIFPVEQRVYDYVVQSALENIAEIFPVNAHEDTPGFQAIILAPLASVALTGRGLSVPELAAVAGLTPAQL